MTDKTDSKEREAFEAWITEDGGDLSTFGTGAHQHYRNSAVNNAWVAWKARASLAASAGSEPVAAIHWPIGGPPRLMWHSNAALHAAIRKAHEGHQSDAPLYLHPFPPEGAGWRPIESFSEDEADEVLAWRPGVGRIIITWLPEGHPDADEGEGWHEAWSHKRVRGITHGMLPPAPPTSSADSRKGE